MRMAGPDIVLFVVGLLLFGGAGYAIITSDGGLSASGSASGIYAVTWSTSEVEVATESVDSFRDASIPFTVSEQNVSRVIFTVDCQDAAGAAVPFQLSVTVTSPDGNTTEPTSAACGDDIVIDIEVAPVPPATNVQGGTEEAARENLHLAEQASAAVGEWTLIITGDRSSAPALPVPVTEPTGSATMAVETWEPSFAPVPR